MKYLKKYNEDVTSLSIFNWGQNLKIEKDFENFCIYLIDEKFDISILRNSIHNVKGKYNQTLCLYRTSNKRSGPYLVHTSEPFLWSDVKYDFMPFLEHIISKYEISIRLINFHIKIDSFYKGQQDWGDIVYSLDDLLSDKISDNEIDNIQIQIIT